MDYGSQYEANKNIGHMPFRWNQDVSHDAFWNTALSLRDPGFMVHYNYILYLEDWIDRKLPWYEDTDPLAIWIRTIEDRAYEAAITMVKEGRV